jgi:hypothetical protein
MATVYVDATISDDLRRERLYAGDFFSFSPSEAGLGLCELARELSENAFAPHRAETAQEHMTPEEYVRILSDLKPTFIHHPRAKELIAALLAGLGCDVDATYFDVPRLRTMAHGTYLNAGLAYQFHPHRDTWFSAPYAQINWWLPVYPIESENSMAFHPAYFGRAVRNGSAEYDYDEWNKTGRKQAAQQVTAETRKQPGPEEEIELEPQVRVVTPVGGVLLFAAAHLHSTVPNTTTRTRFSIDFRTVNAADLASGRGAANVDGACTGTTLRDFMRAGDLEPLPEQLIERYDVPRVPAGAPIG